MRRLLLGGKKEKLRILCLGAHGDDIEIGCGGTMLRLLEEFPGSEARWVVFSRSGDVQREKESRESAEAFLKGAKAEIVVKDFRDGYFPFVGDAIKDCFEELKRAVEPDVILTHHRDDLHQDHQLVSRLTWNTFRDHLILEYEVVKYDGDLGSPNFFVPISEEIAGRKVEYLLRHFESQKYKHWFSADVFRAMMRIRGLECNSPSRYAEAFYNHKLVV